MDTNQPNNEIYKISFYNNSDGYVAFRDWIGYTTDTGRTFSKKYITLTNVNFNGNTVNVTTGFGIAGVKAFNKDNIIVYGDYGLVPSILYSVDGGSTFKLVFHSQFNRNYLTGGIKDICFPENNNIGFAIDDDRVLKTIDKGLNWTIIRSTNNDLFSYIEAVDNNNVFILSTSFTNLIKTTNSGTSWQAVTLPPIPNKRITYTYFITTNTGWLSLYDANNNKYFYKTINGGNSWTLQNDIQVTPFNCKKMRFINDTIGYAISGQNTVYTTKNGGVIWEPLARDNSFSYLNYTHNDLFYSYPGQLWAGGGHGFLEFSNSIANAERPKAYFKIDTIGLSTTGIVNLKNYSLTEYKYKWFLNGESIGNTYNLSYTANKYRSVDSIVLVAYKGVYTDTLIKSQLFKAVPYPPPVISSFTPMKGDKGTLVTITGDYFADVTSVTFGDIPASTFSVLSLTKITAIINNGENGYVKVTTKKGTASLSGFIFSLPPVITSFYPLKATVGSSIVISGKNFSRSITDNVVYISGIKATVTSADTNQLIAIIPVGNTLKSITVTVNNHTAYSNLPLTIVTNPLGCGFNQDDFDEEKKFNLLDYATGLAIRDIDEDGKPEIIATNYNGIAVLKNKCKIGTVDFDAPLFFGNVGNPTEDLADADFDGDGKTDFVVTSRGTNIITILKNNTSNGIINFSSVAAISLPLSSISIGVAVNDIDGDGKPDIVITSYSKSTYLTELIVYKNASTNNNLTFNRKFSLEVNVTTEHICIGDLDFDSKPDIFIPAFFGGNLKILKNTSTLGNISFDILNTNVNSANIRDASLVDIDSDGKLDIVASREVKPSIAIYRNISSVGNILFDTLYAFYACDYTSTSIAPGDIDGDGKIDLFNACFFYIDGRIARNLSIPGKISIVDANTSQNQIFPQTFKKALIADIDGDSRPEIVASVYAGPLFIYRNLLNNSAPCNNVLPAQWLSFFGKEEKNNIILHWTTSAQINTKIFIIERRDNTGNWRIIGNKEAASNNLTLMDYSFIDNNALQGNNLYRIQLIDMDGKFSYSQSVEVYLERKISTISVYPNPVKDNLLKINTANPFAEIKLFSSDGKMLIKNNYKPTTTGTTIIVPPIRAGIYLLKVIYRNGDQENITVLKQ